MPLSGKAVAELQNALISAFSADELTRLVRIHLDENLDAIAGDDNLKQKVFNLIEWAERYGRLDDLIRGTERENPGNQDLLTWIETYATSDYKQEKTFRAVEQTTARDNRGCFFEYGRLSISIVVVTLLGLMLYTFLMDVSGEPSTSPHWRIEYLRNRIEKIFAPPSSTPSIIKVPSKGTHIPPTLTNTSTPTNPSTPTNTPTPTPLFNVVNDITFVYIPSGSFTMGSNDGNDDEKPLHTVDVDGFWMMQTEVTKAQYKRCMDEGPCTEPRDGRINNIAYDNHPVGGVTWYQANAYAEWSSGRLPTEAEWEYACRGSDGRVYSWGNEEPSTSRLNYRDSTIGNTTRVGRYPAGANGLYDMAGNVREWTSTQYEDYPYKVNDGREGQDGDNRRTLRGGSFNYNRNDVRCAIRDSLVPWLDWNNDGFRVVMLESPDFLPNESSGP